MLQPLNQFPLFPQLNQENIQNCMPHYCLPLMLYPLRTLVPLFQSIKFVTPIPTVPGPPVFAKARRLDAEKLESARKEFAAMEAAGVICRSNSPWASPLHMVQKPDGSWHPCGDYRRLNTQTILDQYPLPNLADFTSRLNGCTIFTKLDLTKGYYQVPMAKGDIPKTAVITPFGLFEWIRMPFGLRNAGF